MRMMPLLEAQAIAKQRLAANRPMLWTGDNQKNIP
jgi:hypothetical protein